MEAGPTPLRVVFVCTGNRFRSPLAAEIFRRSARSLPVDVSSVGILELGAAPPLTEAVEEARRLGLDLSAHRARPLSSTSLADADLVVGFERMHIVAAVVDAGAARERTFTLPELVELVESVEPPHDGDAVQRARTAIASAAAGRRVDPAYSRLPEIADPIGEPSRHQHAIAESVHALTVRLARALSPTDA